MNVTCAELNHDPHARGREGKFMKVKHYLHYVPEFDELIVCEKRYTSFWRDGFKNNAKGKTKLVLIAIGDFGFKNY